ncbi:MAG: hypothetical protein OXC48_05085 [Endozoicomonadaceae bacterium]|nr:hypothetical protein [Endozoicomonadaceae bacterium]
MDENTVKKMALVVAASCLMKEPGDPKTVSEISSQLNKQVSDRLYTFLLYLLNKPSNEYSALMNELTKNYPEDWNFPELDPKFTQIANQTAHDRGENRVFL